MTATAIINKATRIRTTKTKVKVITTSRVLIPNKDTTKAVMDTMTNRMFPAARTRYIAELTKQQRLL
jgi:hypothetical protein